jgi:hypothetical protein
MLQVAVHPDDLFRHLLRLPTNSAPPGADSMLYVTSLGVGKPRSAESLRMVSSQYGWKTCFARPAPEGRSRGTPALFRGHHGAIYRIPVDEGKDSQFHRG